MDMMTTEGSSVLSHDVKVGGVSLKLRSSHDKKTVAELASLVNKVLSEVTGDQDIPFQKALLMSSLCLAEKLVMVRRSMQQELSQMESQIYDILGRMENSSVSSTTSISSTDC